MRAHFRGFSTHSLASFFFSLVSFFFRLALHLIFGFLGSLAPALGHSGVPVQVVASVTHPFLRLPPEAAAVLRAGGGVVARGLCVGGVTYENQIPRCAR